MTTICAYVQPGTGRTWVGADTMVTQSNGVIIPARFEKFRHIGAWWIGLAGNPSAMQEIEGIADAIVGFGGDHRAVVQAIRKAWAAAEFNRTPDGDGPPNYNQWLILARRGVIFGVSGSGSITRSATPFYAEGSGYQVAFGAAWAATCGYSHAVDGEGLLRSALSAAINYDVATGGDIMIEEID